MILLNQLTMFHWQLIRSKPFINTHLKVRVTKMSETVVWSTRGIFSCWPVRCLKLIGRYLPPEDKPCVYGKFYCIVNFSMPIPQYERRW